MLSTELNSDEKNGSNSLLRSNEKRKSESSCLANEKNKLTSVERFHDSRFDLLNLIGSESCRDSKNPLMFRIGHINCPNGIVSIYKNDIESLEGNKFVWDSIIEVKDNIEYDLLKIENKTRIKFWPMNCTNYINGKTDEELYDNCIMWIKYKEPQQIVEVLQSQVLHYTHFEDFHYSAFIPTNLNALFFTEFSKSEVRIFLL